MLETIIVIEPGAQPGGAFKAFFPPEIFETLHSNFDIYRNFQIIQLKYCILIIFKKSLLRIFLCLTGYLPPRMIYLETGHLIEYFVNDWYFNHKYAGIGKSFKMLAAYL